MKNSTLEKLNEFYDNSFVELWNRVFDQYTKADKRVWYAGPTSYVFSVNNVKFAMDLQIRRQKDFTKLLPNLIEQTRKLSFVLITHEHDDHMCLPLMKALRDTDIKWYIPAESKRDLVESAELKRENVIYLNSGDKFNVDGIEICAFDSPHTADPTVKFAQLGYEITFDDYTMIFPGDVRDYSYRAYPKLKNADLCFSHLWAGDDAINEENYMPKIKDFVEFNCQFKAKRYFLGHLYEIGREEKYMWKYHHCGISMDYFFRVLPNSVVEVPLIGHSYEIGS